MPRPALDLVAARRWAITARLMLGAARERIDALNVFPVADGDTGTNMSLTMDGALDYVRVQFELGAGTDRLQEGLALIARGMLLSARGNSGVILSQLTRGLADAVGADVEQAGPQDVAQAFETAAQTAWDALAAPVEGTILTVARAAAHGARGAVDRGRPATGDGPLEVRHVVAEALDAAERALARTPEQLPELGAAGVVDAGGAGLVLVIEALQAVLEDRSPGAGQELPDWWVVAPASDSSGRPEAGRPRQDGGEQTHAPGRVHPDGGGTTAATGGGHGGPSDVEVMYTLTASDRERADRLRRHLAQLGSSVVVGGGPEEFTVHVHLPDPRAAVEAGSLAGIVTQVRLTSLTDGAEVHHVAAAGKDPVRSSEDRTAGPPDPPTSAQGVAVVACALGRGVTELFEQSGATVVSSGPRRRASAGQLLAAVSACGADRVVVLPNDSDTVLVARAAAVEAAAAGIAVDVVPTRTLVEGLAAVAVLDPEGGHDEAVAAMTDAAAGVRAAVLTRADRAAQTPVGPCRPGQWLGILEQGIVAVDDELGPVLTVVVDQVWHEDCEVVTVLLGLEADDHVEATVDRALAERAAGAQAPEILTLRGDQPTYPVLLGVE